MRFTFVHTADWQIGKPFAGFPPEKAPLLRQARLDVIGRIAETARSVGAGHILVAGDVYDSPDVPERDLHQSLDKMRREEGLIWHLLPGNHDPQQAGGIWERLARIGLPGNVTLHLQPGSVTIADGVALLPAPLNGRTSSDDPTAWMDQAATPGAQYRIGLAHGSIQGFGSGDGDASVPIAPKRPELAGLDYLALGDWHGATQISSRAWYSGTPEPDRFPDNEPGFVLVVTLEGPGAPPVVERRATAHFTWWKRDVTVTGQETMAHFERSIVETVSHPERLLVKLALRGTATLSAWADAEERLAALDRRLFHLSVDKTALQVLPEAIELEEFGAGD
ncbi:MAG: DNA repair exonuclease, partial [Hyphomicrobiaceae bacterium]